MRSCMQCSWWTQDPDDHLGGRCGALPTCAKRQYAQEACALWKPERGWRAETCGTCDYLGEKECLRGPPTVVWAPLLNGAYSFRPAVDIHKAACSLWHPKTPSIRARLGEKARDVKEVVELKVAEQSDSDKEE